MTVETIRCPVSPFNPEGRVVGSFVYLLLCWDETRIYIKVGHSIQPEKRFHTLRNGCPVTPRTFSVIAVPGTEIAKALEADLHASFAKWRVAGEWFSLSVADKAEFNAKLREAMKAHARPAYPLKITKVPAKLMIQLAQQRLAYWRQRFKRRGAAYRDFVRQQN
jgi:hypothetical protein